MQVNNQSNSEVHWNQGSGGAPQGLATQDPNNSGNLAPGKGTGPFPPDGKAPYTVTFTDPDHSVTSCPFSDPEATVTLEADWRVTVSSGCDE